MCIQIIYNILNKFIYNRWFLIPSITSMVIGVTIIILTFTLVIFFMKN